MTEQLIGETGSKKRRRFLSCQSARRMHLRRCGAQAVHDETFQLDGNTVTARRRTSAVTRRTSTGEPVRREQRHVALPAGFGDVEPRPRLRRAPVLFVTNNQTTSRPGARTRCRSRLAVQLRQQRQQQDRRDELVRGHLYRPDGDGSSTSGSSERQHRYRECRLLVPAILRLLRRRPAARSPSPESTQDGDLLVVSEFSGGGTVSPSTPTAGTGR